MGARRFGPDTSQFLSRDRYLGAFADLGLTFDPLTGNRYALAAGNPISYIETDGHVTRRNGGGGAITTSTSSTATSTGSAGCYPSAGGYPACGSAPTETNTNVPYPACANGPETLCDEIAAMAAQNCTGWCRVGVYGFATVGAAVVFAPVAFGVGGELAVIGGHALAGEVSFVSGGSVTATTGLGVTAGARIAGAAKSSSETAGGITNLGRAGAAARLNFADFSTGQGFSGVYDEATGSVLAFPSTRASTLPENWVSARGGHAVVNRRLTQAIGEPTGRRAGFTAFLEADGRLRVEWLSRSVNGAADPYAGGPSVGILESLAAATGRGAFG